MPDSLSNGNVNLAELLTTWQGASHKAAVPLQAKVTRSQISNKHFMLPEQLAEAARF